MSYQDVAANKIYCQSHMHERDFSLEVKQWEKDSYIKYLQVFQDQFEKYLIAV